MAGKSRRLLGQLQGLYEAASALADELDKLGTKHARFRTGLWQLHGSAAHDALEDAADKLEMLTLLAGDSVQARADQNGGQTEKACLSPTDSTPTGVGGGFCPHPPAVVRETPNLA